MYIRHSTGVQPTIYIRQGDEKFSLELVEWDYHGGLMRISGIGLPWRLNELCGIRKLECYNIVNRNYPKIN